MQGPNEVFSKEFNADGRVTKYRIVRKGALEDDLAMATKKDHSLMGVAQHDALDNERVRLMMIGISKVEYGGAVTQGDLLTTDENGKAVEAARHTHVENEAGAYTQEAQTSTAEEIRVIGMAMADGVAGDIGTVFLTQGMI